MVGPKLFVIATPLSVIYRVDRALMVDGVDKSGGAAAGAGWNCIGDGRAACSIGKRSSGPICVIWYARMALLLVVLWRRGLCGSHLVMLNGPSPILISINGRAIYTKIGSSRAPFDDIYICIEMPRATDVTRCDDDTTKRPTRCA